MRKKKIYKELCIVYAKSRFYTYKSETSYCKLIIIVFRGSYDTKHVKEMNTFYELHYNGDIVKHLPSKRDYKYFMGDYALHSSQK